MPFLTRCIVTKNINQILRPKSNVGRSAANPRSASSRKKPDKGTRLFAFREMTIHPITDMGRLPVLTVDRFISKPPLASGLKLMSARSFGLSRMMSLQTVTISITIAATALPAAAIAANNAMRPGSESGTMAIPPIDNCYFGSWLCCFCFATASLAFCSISSFSSCLSFSAA